MHLQVIIASTRPGRAGLPIAQWFLEEARRHGGWEVRVSDLKQMQLPLLDEPRHPRLEQYEHDHTRAWSATVDAADAFVMVTPEYNYGSPPALINALDYLYREWNYKPAGFVSYGGISGGIRSAQMTKQVLTTLKMVPIVEAVPIPFFAKHMTEAGVFEGTEAHALAARTMLDELARWASALRVLRPPPASAAS